MAQVGIEAIHVFGGTTYIDVMELVHHRGMDAGRFESLLMKEKSVAMPYEDPVSFGVNAAKPIIDALSEEDKNKIELLITCSESGIDFGKSMSTYIHHYLDLSRNCRMFEMKQACYSGTAGYQMAVNFILSQASPGAKALIIATDISRFIVNDGEDIQEKDWAFVEPSSGAGAVAMLISDQPDVFQVDIGANGYYSYEEMGVCRPIPDSEFGHTDTSLMSYLDCCERSYDEYQKRVKGADYGKTFDYLTFHTPFGGIVKSAHRTMMRKVVKAKPREIAEDFQRRVVPGLNYCERMGNVMGGTVFLALVSTILNGDCNTPKRVGCFGYGSGCSSEFFSGIIKPQGKMKLEGYGIREQLDQRYKLSMEEYDEMLRESNNVRFGTRNVTCNLAKLPQIIRQRSGRKLLVLEGIKEFHREYRWV